MTHPARAMPFDELWAGLQDAVAARRVRESLGADGLRLYCYTETTVYERSWDTFTLMARGLILDPAARAVVATPFPKFFNAGEVGTAPDLPFEAFEKLDGSLIILFHHRGQWLCATKGSLVSDQAAWAARWLAGRDLAALSVGTTYLAEAIYPANRIVVHYPTSGLVLLGGYRADGGELDYAALQGVGERLGWPVTRRRSFGAVSELLVLAKTLPTSEEGFVIRFSNGLRLKVKGDEYCRVHRLISGLSPLSMWGALQAGDDLDAVRRQLPEEFWADFDAIIALLRRQVDDFVAGVAADAAAVAHLSDKELGLTLPTLSESARRFVFPYRKANGDLLSGPARVAVFRAIRPDNNHLDGYMPSSAVDRVREESA